MRVALHKKRHGGFFNYHGLDVSIPAEINFSIKKAVMNSTYEEPERLLVSRYVDPSLPVIELGGSLGILSSYLSNILNADTAYTIVEANPNIVDICRENALRPKPKRSLTVINAAIAYDVDAVRFEISDNILGNKISSGDNVATVDVPARTLTSLVSEAMSAGYTLVMDIEGSELDVLEHDAEAFENCRLTIVEVHPKAYERRGKSEADFMSAAKSIGLKQIDRIENSVVFIHA